MPRIRVRQSFSFLAALRDRNVILLLSGQTLSQFGNEFYVVALPWLFLETHRLGSLGVVLAGYGVGRIAALAIGGIAADRLGYRTTMLIADGGRAILVGIMWLDVDMVARNLAIGFPLITALGLLAGLFQPAYGASIPHLVSSDDLAGMNSANTALTGFASLLGPVAAGVVVGEADPALAFGIDALSFVVSFASLVFMRRTSVPGAAPDGRREERRAIRWNWLAEWVDIVRAVPALRGALRVMVIANLTWAGLVEVALPRLVYGWSGGHSIGYGVVLGSAAVGGIVGSLFASSMARRNGSGGLAMLAGLVQAVCIAVTPLAGVPYIAAAIFLPLGIANSLTNIVMITLAQQGIPKERLGRAMALVQFCSYAPYSVSALLGAVVTRSLGPSFMFEITACGMAAAFLTGLRRDPYRLARRSRTPAPAKIPESLP